MTTLLPNAKQQFLSANGAPLAGGSVYFYIPGTTTFKNTWQDASQVTLNTNPVILDAAGEAVIFGLGAYRQIVFDALGNQIWDQLTSSTDAGGIYSGGTSTGTAANQILAATIPAGFAFTAGNQLTFIAGFTSTGATTLNANGTGAKPITKPGTSGPVPLTAGDIVVGDAVVLYVDGTQYQLINPVALPLTGGNLSGAVNEAKAVVASATTTPIGAAAGNYIQITGTTTITAFDTVQAGARRKLEFAGAVLLTYNATSLILPEAANVTTVAGDVWEFTSEGAGNWRATQWPVRFATKAIMQAATDNAAVVTPAGLGGSDAVAKAWVNFTNTGGAVTINASYNVTSVTRTSQGIFVITFTVPFATTAYGAIISGTGSGFPLVGIATSQLVGSFTVTLDRTDTLAVTDPSNSATAVFFGRQ